MGIQIEKTPGFKVGELSFTSLLAAQKYAIGELLETLSPTTGDKPTIQEIVDWMFSNSTAILSIFKSTGRKPRVAKKKTAVKAATPRAGKVQTEIPKA